jgi:uncharacterized protein (DUF1778 family)
MAEEIARRRGGQLPLGGPGSGRSDLVVLRMAKDQKRKMEQAAAAADLPVSSFIRQSVLREILRTLADEDERNDPEMRKYLDEQRRRSKSPRQRALAGRFEPK